MFSFIKLFTFPFPFWADFLASYLTSERYIIMECLHRSSIKTISICTHKSYLVQLEWLTLLVPIYDLCLHFWSVISSDLLKNIPPVIFFTWRIDFPIILDHYQYINMFQCLLFKKIILGPISLCRCYPIFLFHILREKISSDTLYPSLFYFFGTYSNQDVFRRIY